ncbi:MAG: 2TM domain-containing protein [Rhodospirillaceae bacterium]|jgi:hypothetical protein|nr:2TM domain-containing protein [Rhodospirillaceae bacterium]MBT5809894.1 2TM domain-containing protein [Rhodospirillaceae bacterium]
MENAAKQNLTSPYAFRVHGAVYLGVNAALFILDWAIGGAWWFHFTALIWGFVLVIHFLVMKTFSVDENWADERSAKLRHGSYDVGHIIQISDDYNDAEAGDGGDESNGGRGQENERHKE